MIVCVCNAVSDSEIKDWVALGGRTVGQIQADLGLGTCCGKCCDCAAEIIQEALVADVALEDIQAVSVRRLSDATIVSPHSSE